MVDKNGLTTRQSRWLGNSYNDYEITFEDKVYKVLHQKGSWDIFAIQDRVNKYYVTTVKTIEQAKFYILYNLGERKWVTHNGIHGQSIWKKPY